MKKKVLSVMLVIAMTSTLLTACGNTNTSSTPQSFDNSPITSSSPSYQESSYTQTSTSVSKADLSSQVSKNTLTTSKEKYFETLNIINNATLQYPTANDEFEYNVYDTYVQITKYIGDDIDIVFPSKIDNLPVLVVGDYYNRMKVIEKYNVNISLMEENGEYVTKSDKFVSLTFSDGIAIIGHSAFEASLTGGSYAVTKIKFPNSLIAVGERAFTHLDSLTSLTFPEGIYDIGEYSFSASFHFDEMTLPKSLGILRNYAFGGYMSKVTILNPDTQIGINSLPNPNSQTNKLEIYGYAGSTAAKYAAEHNDLYLFKVINN